MTRVREPNKPPVPATGMIVFRTMDKFGKLNFEVLVDGKMISATILDLGSID